MIVYSSKPEQEHEHRIFENRQQVACLLKKCCEKYKKKKRCKKCPDR